MTDKQHPITPPDELVEQWKIEWDSIPPGVSALAYIATQAARWGADQELEACCWWLRTNKGACFSSFVERELLDARRPKPPSLAEEALALISHDPENQPFLSEKGIAIIRRALERLQELEKDID